VKKKIFLLALCFAISAQSAPWCDKSEVDSRWEAFQEGRAFTQFQPGRSDSELMAEFEKLNEIRLHLWEEAEYERAKELVANDLIRAPGCVAFAYNNTVPYYNGSTIYLRGKRYIACEGPRSKDIPAFFQMLKEQEVTHLIRLTDAYEGEVKRCHPYWEGILSEGQLNLPGDYTIRAYDMAYWRDNQGVDPAKLLEQVLEVREELKRTDGLLVIHCSAGVGRTGTFFASLAIVDAIDAGEPFSIEEIVALLSLQRIHSVGKPIQYVVLHRLAEIYMETK